MKARANLELERAEIDAVLASTIFAKSPNLGKMLQYIGQKYLEGEGHLIKEYNIGVEALGRPTDFDPKEDSIVRVEAHRLRQKLKQYYETEGALHPVVINLQVGHYIPQFLSRSEITEHSAEGSIPGTMPETSGGGNREMALVQTQRPTATPPDLALAVASTVAGGTRHAVGWAQRHKLLMASGPLVLIAAIGVLAFIRSRPETASLVVPRPSKASGVVAAGAEENVRIIAGYSKKEYVDGMGKTWGSDRYFTGGEAVVEPQVFIARAPDPTLFETAREGEFSYNIPLKPGTYELRLYFVETDYGPGTLRGGGEVSRLFHLDINGKRTLTDFDVYSDAGGSFIADERVFKDVSPAPDGSLYLKWTKAIDYPMVNALEVVPASPHTIQPVRIVTQERSYTDEMGRLWSPDRYFSGGRLVAHSRVVENTPDPGLYSEERYGHFDYAIPVAEGRYALTLYFAETYFGANNAGKAGVGSRLFDVYCNGAALLRSFDVFKEAGSENRALVRTFHGLRPNAMGKLMLSFVPVRNYATVKAIEVVEESK